MEPKKRDLPIILDFGSSSCRAGLGGNKEPTITFPSIVGYPRVNAHQFPIDTRFVGHDAIQRREILSITAPIEQGVATNWSCMEKLYEYAFSELDVKPTDHPIFLTEAPGNPKANREKLAQLMFETYATPALHLANRAEMALYASGLSSGLVIQSGFQITNIVPVHEGRALSDVACSLPVGGDTIRNFLKQLMMREVAFTKPGWGDDNLAKEHLAYLALDFEYELQLPLQTIEKTYKSYSATTQRFQCAEILFDPTACGIEASGIHELTRRAILQSPEEIRKDLFGNVVLAGGNTLIPGFAERITKELVFLAPSNMSVNVVSSPDRLNSSWVGASIFSTSPDIKYISAEEYDETGPTVVSRELQ